MDSGREITLPYFLTSADLLESKQVQNKLISPPYKGEDNGSYLLSDSFKKHEEQYKEAPCKYPHHSL